jgi:cytochrome d ubiquinol oxidase subunit II
MENALFWPTALYAMLCCIMAGYTLLDGFDLGLGMLLPFFPAEPERRLLLNAMAPVWDGNEVWLIIAGGVLFGAFPPVYAAAMTGFYLFVMLAVFCLILRATSFEFWFHDEKRRILWGWIFSASSLLIPVLLGLLVGNVVAGVPLTADFKYAGTWYAVFRPYPWMVAITGLALFFFQGVAYAIVKTEGALQAKAVVLGQRGWWAVLFAALGLAAFTLWNLPGSGGKAAFWIGLALAALSLGLTGVSLFRKTTQALFLKASLGFIGLWVLLAGVQFPYLIRALPASAPGLNLSNAASPVGVLKILAGFVVAGMLLVLANTWFVYRVFKGKTKPGEGY